MRFFSSDVVKAEMREISEMQQKIYANIFKFDNMTKEDQLDHLNLLETFVEKQKILYTRISLSDDIEAIQLKQHILDSISLFGAPKDVGMNTVFDNMLNSISLLKKELDTAD